ncbi:hypothetical protein GCM10025874_16640 [Arenivirga flava]|uniref:Uncharacterized protein n=1 Tax=Arenivirga flava TaxID=1930060 RepID=A0AA37XBB1_9MICO|nr:hypothetical protein GCM10025874_16640 [Arenivirga flava]
MAEGEPADQRADGEDGEHDARLEAVVAEHRDDARLDGRGGADEQHTHHGGDGHDRLEEHLAEAAAAAGMRTRPSSGELRKKRPPTRVSAAGTSTPQAVPICVEMKVMATGPAIQMTSCALASSEKSGVSCFALTIFG